jgi:hypothetical protein
MTLLLSSLQKNKVKLFLARFEEKSRTIHELDEQLQKLHFSTEALADYRKNLAISAGNVSRWLILSNLFLLTFMVWQNRQFYLIVYLLSVFMKLS